MRVSKAFRRVARPLHWGVAARLPLTARRHYLHAANTRRWGNFSHPVTYNEKMNWRILHDRRPGLATLCDKLHMKDEARSIIPDHGVLRIPETYWFGESMEDAPDLDRFGAYVVKPNNGSGDVLFGPLEKSDLLQRTAGWLHSKPAHQLGEWGYVQARELFLVEERVPSGTTAPIDFKFFVFDGSVGFIQMNVGRFEGDPSWTFYSREWEFLPVGRRGYARTQMPRPEALPGMIDIAERLAAGWDHLRVDLYCVEGEVWFGEFSPYHHGGVFPFDPASYDRTFGALWTLPEGND